MKPEHKKSRLTEMKNLAGKYVLANHQEYRLDIFDLLDITAYTENISCYDYNFRMQHRNYMALTAYEACMHNDISLDDTKALLIYIYHTAWHHFFTLWTFTPDIYLTSSYTPELSDHSTFKESLNKFHSGLSDKDKVSDEVFNTVMKLMRKAKAGPRRSVLEDCLFDTLMSFVYVNNDLFKAEFYKQAQEKFSIANGVGERHAHEFLMNKLLLNKWNTTWGKRRYFQLNYPKAVNEFSELTKPKGIFG